VKSSSELFLFSAAPLLSGVRHSIAKSRKDIDRNSFAPSSAFSSVIPLLSSIASAAAARNLSCSSLVTLMSAFPCVCSGFFSSRICSRILSFTWSTLYPPLIYSSASTPKSLLKSVMSSARFLSASAGFSFAPSGFSSFCSFSISLFFLSSSSISRCNVSNCCCSSSFRSRFSAFAVSTSFCCFFAFSLFISSRSIMFLLVKNINFCLFQAGVRILPAGYLPSPPDLPSGVPDLFQLLPCHPQG